jgi:hypothetical protein
MSVPSSHATEHGAVPFVHAPPWHVSAPLQNWPSEHEKPSTWNALAGHVLLTPSQLSATSHAPADGRHTAVLFASAGQLMLEPVQFSARSHDPAAARHTVVFGAS